MQPDVCSNTTLKRLNRNVSSLLCGRLANPFHPLSQTNADRSTWDICLVDVGAATGQAFIEGAGTFNAVEFVLCLNMQDAVRGHGASGG